MQANNRKKPQELDKRKEKERKREEKELRKMAAANGIKMPKAQTPGLTQIAVADSSNNIDADATPPRYLKKVEVLPTVPPSSSMPSGGFKSLDGQ
jgi:hypothetical protein